MATNDKNLTKLFFEDLIENKTKKKIITKIIEEEDIDKVAKKLIEED